MFNNFDVPENQRDLLRFYWFRNNNPDEELVLYRLKTHPFGLTSSPAVASYSLKLCAMRPLTQKFESAQEYIMKSFYVDDGMNSDCDIKTAVDTLTNARELLSGYNLRLHKIMSNKREVLEAFPASEVAVDLKL